MKRNKDDHFKDFENMVAEKRMNNNKKASHTVPTEITVQRMAPTPSGRLKKFEPLDTRDFVPFSKFFELSLEKKYQGRM